METQGWNPGGQTPLIKRADFVRRVAHSFYSTWNLHRPGARAVKGSDPGVEDARALGRYLVRHWEQLSLVKGESLVYWLRKLVFRGAWLDHRVKEGLLEVNWDEQEGEFGYRDPRGDRALLELAPVPSWHEVQFRR